MPTMVHGDDMKRLDFAKEGHHYSFVYDDVRELINHIVDLADSPECQFDLMDVFAIVKRLAHTQVSAA